MRAPLSIIIPTLNAETALPGCAASLMEGVNAGLIRELIVSDGWSSDATSRIAAEIGAMVITGAASRGGQIGRGVDAAGGEWLLILHADTQLSPGWSDAVAAHMTAAGSQEALPAYFRLAFDHPGIGAHHRRLGQSAQPPVRSALRRSGAADPRRAVASGGWLSRSSAHGGCRALPASVPTARAACHRSNKLCQIRLRRLDAPRWAEPPVADPIPFRGGPARSSASLSAVIPSVLNCKSCSRA